SASACISAAATDTWMCSRSKGTPTAARPTSRRYPAHELRCLFPNSTGFSSPLALIPANRQPYGYFAHYRKLRRNLSSNMSTVRYLRQPYRQTWLTTYTSRTCDCRRSSRLTRHKPALNGPLQHQGDHARLPDEKDRRAEGRMHSLECAQRPSRIGRMDEGSITMATGVVVVYFSRFGKPLQTHHKVVLDLDAKAIAKLKGYKFGGTTMLHVTTPARSFSCRMTPCCWTKQHVSAFVLRMTSTAALCPIFS